MTPFGSPICVEFQKISQEWSIKMFGAQAIFESPPHLSSILITLPNAILVESNSWEVINLIDNGSFDFTK